MNGLDDFGDGVLAVAEGQMEVARLLGAAIGRGLTRLADAALEFGAALGR